MSKSASIRPAEAIDAQSMLELFEALDSETEFMFFEPGERTTTKQQQVERIEHSMDNEYSVLRVAELGNQIVGFAAGFSSVGVRNRHVLTLVVGVRKEFWRSGIGAKLMIAMEEWAVANHKRKLELTVMCDNIQAIALYSCLGFDKEGIKRRSVRLQDRYVDEFHMGKLL